MAYLNSDSEGDDNSPSVGVGLRHCHFQHVLEYKPDIPWFEVHSENFFQKGGASIAALSEIIQHYPLSLHGVNLSLGSADGLDELHLEKLRDLVDWTRPFLLSEHLSWGRIGPNYTNDLLPVPYTDDVLDVFLRNIDKVQQRLGQKILIENPSSYLEFNETVYHEADFMNKICEKTNAGLLLDINNIYVSCQNHDWDIQDYMSRIHSDFVSEIHLAGHSIKDIDGHEFRIDDHASQVCREVWSIYQNFIKKNGARNSLIEWDRDIPAFSVLQDEALKAENILNQYCRSRKKVAL